MHPSSALIAALVLALPVSAQAPTPIWIHGHVILPEATPPGASVSVLARRGIASAPITGAALAGARVDACGDFGFTLDLEDAGFYLALDSHWLDLRPLWIEARPGESSIEIVLAPALRGVLRGRFVAPGGERLPSRPLAGSWVWIEGQELHATETDEEGGFELSGAAAGMSGVLCAHPRDFAPLCITAPALREGDATEFEWALVEAASLSGRIVDRAGNGLPGVTLSFWRGFDAQRPLAIDPFGDVQAVTSDESGAFEARELPPGDLTLRIEDPRWRAQAARVLGLEPGEARTGCEVVLLRAGSLRGRVLDEYGAPVAGARVTAGMREALGGLMIATTDALGRYAFDAALPGEYVLSFSCEGRAARSAGIVALEECERVQTSALLGRGIALRVQVGDHAAPVRVLVSDALGFLRADQRVWQGELDLTLPPGLYRVALVTREGVRHERKLLLTGHERDGFTLRM